MDNAGLGFLLGATPGAFLMLRNMFGQAKAAAEAKRIAEARGERFDYNTDLSAQNGFSFKTSEFIKPGDGPGVREAKEMLLARRDKFLATHIKGIAVLAAGAFIGALLGAVVNLFTRHVLGLAL